MNRLMLCAILLTSIAGFPARYPSMVIFYDLEDGVGDNLIVFTNITECLDMAEMSFDKMVRSVEFFKVSCIYLFAERNCTGEQVKVTENNNENYYLSKLNFDGKASSSRLCND